MARNLRARCVDCGSHLHHGNAKRCRRCGLTHRNSYRSSHFANQRRAENKRAQREREAPGRKPAKPVQMRDDFVLAFTELHAEYRRVIEHMTVSTWVEPSDPTHITVERKYA